MTSIILSFLPVVLATNLGAAPATRSTSSALPNPFFAMDTATKDQQHQTVEAQVRMVKELGFAGWGPGYKDDLSGMLAALDAAKLDLSALYLPVVIDAAGPKFPASVSGNIDKLRGRGTIIWTVIRSEKRSPRSPELDRATVQALRDLAALADKAGVRVAVYPHNGDYIARHRDALEIIRAVDRPNVGLSFNLCHWLRAETDRDLERLLKDAMPHLFVVSINGADRDNPDPNDWSRYIRPLGQGDFDVYGLLRTLRRLGFSGPVGLQGYGLKGSMEEHLRTAMKTWREYGERLSRER